MRVVNRQTFMTLPASTIYAKGPKWAFDHIMIKGETLAHDGRNIDWWCVNMAWPDGDTPEIACNALDESLEKGTSFACDQTIGRDGCFDDKDMFLIFERADLEVLQGYVNEAMKVADR